MKKLHPTFIDVQTRADPNLAHLYQADDDQTRGALIPETAEVIALSYWNELDDQVHVATTCPDDPRQFNEITLLQTFVQVAEKYEPLIFWNADFTLGVLLARMAYHRLRFRQLLDTKPWNWKVIDVIRLRYPRLYGAKSLEWHARALGFDMPPGINGSQIPDLYDTEPETIKSYSRGRLLMLRNICQIWQGVYLPDWQIGDYSSQWQAEIAHIISGLPEKYQSRKET